MYNFVIDLLSLIIFVSAIGTFITLKPLFKSLSKTQKIWVIVLVVSVIISFLLTEVPDFVQGMLNGINSGK